jgi:hypothetical protein
VLGLLNNNFANLLASEYSETFSIKKSSITVSPLHKSELSLSLSNKVVESSFDDRTNAVAKVTSNLRDRGLLRGWRNELFQLSSSFSSRPELLIERAACPYFGIKAYGVHINGFVRKNGIISSIWVARRSKVIN